MATIINGTLFVPGLNGSLIDDNLCTVKLCPMDYAQVNYVPTFGGNLAYLIIFALLLAAQAVMGSFYRTWGFLVGMAAGLLLEIIGYVGRVGLHNNPFDFNQFIIYIVCLTIAPAFLTASIYLCLGRLVVIYGANISRFSPKFYTLTFITCDLISLVLQAAGGAMAATQDAGNPSDTGVNMMIAGLSFQVVSLIIFMSLGLEFAYRARKARESQLDHRFIELRKRLLFRLFPYAIALATTTIFIRSVYRVAELKDGFGGKLANDEPLFMVFEGPMIIIAVVCLTACHPGVAVGGAANWRAANWTWKKQDSGVVTMVQQEHEMGFTSSDSPKPYSGV